MDSDAVCEQDGVQWLDGPVSMYGEEACWCAMRWALAWKGDAMQP